MMSLSAEGGGAEQPSAASERSQGAGVGEKRFIGRAKELNAIVEALDGAVEGAGAVILVAGEPGIGKTRLAKEASRLAEERAFKVFWGRAWEAGGAPALWPWIEIVRSYASSVDEQSLRADIGGHASLLASLVPDMAALLGVPGNTAVEAEAEKFLMFDAVSHLLRSAAAVAPLMLIVDDLHAADQSSLLLLQFLVSRIDDHPIVIVGAFRDTAQDLTGRERQMISDIAVQATLLQVHGLRTEETKEFVGAAVGRQVQEEVVLAIHEKTAGNPLFLDEVLRTLLGISDSDQITAVGIRIPKHLRDQIRRRLEAFDDDLLSVLGAASVIGRDFDVVTLSRITGKPEMDLQQLLEVAEKSGVIGSQQIGRHSFSHVLFQETLYDHLPNSARTRLHLDAALALEGMGDVSQVAPSVASHYQKIAGAGYAAEASLWLKHAGDAAIKARAFDEAVVHFQEALHIQEAVSPATEDRIELLLSLGKAMRLAGDDRAPATLRQAAELARESGQALLFARAILEFTPSLGSINPADRDMPDLVETALEMLGDHDLELRARLLCRFAVLSLRIPDLAELRASRVAEAKHLAQKLESPTLHAVVATSELLINEDLPHPRMVGEAQETLEIAIAGGNVELTLEARALLISRRLLLGQRQVALEELQIYARLAEEVRSPFHLWSSRVVRACQQLLEGNLEAAIALSDEALQRGTSAPLYDPVVAWGALRGSIWLVLRDPEWFQQMVPFMESAVQMYPTQPIPRLGFAHYYAYQGQQADGREWLESIGPAPVESLPRDIRWLGTMSMLGELAMLLNEPELGRTVHAELAPYGDYLAFQGRGASLWGIPRLSMATAAAAAGLADEAEQHFEAAIRSTATTSIKPYQGHTHFYYGWFLMQSGEVPKAKTHLTRAKAIFERLGMRYPAAKSEDLLRSKPALERAAGTAHLKRQGDTWSVGFEDRSFNLKDVKGLGYLAKLISSPDREFAALDLATETAGETRATPEGLSAGALDPGLETIDAQARRAYTERIKLLGSEIEEAHDPEMRARLQEEMDTLVQMLAGAVGLGGRTRKTSSAAERARLSVYRAIRSAIDRIAEHDPTLGKHLEVSVKTGAFCSYSPDASSPIRWET